MHNDGLFLVYRSVCTRHAEKDLDKHPKNPVSFSKAVP